MSDQFKFTLDYQWDLLRYIVKDANGYKALKKIKDTYFTLTEHQVIAKALTDIYKNTKTVPGSTVLKEHIRILLSGKDYQNLVTKDERQEILNLTGQIFEGTVKDGDQIYEYCKEFSSYVEVKNIIENVDLNNFSEYPTFARKIQSATTDQDMLEDTKTAMLFGNVRERQFKRQENKVIIPTPFRQINALTNAGGYDVGSIIVILDQQKKGKTAALVNVTKGYVKLRKSVLFIDLENGQDAIMTRLEQSIMNLSKKQILTGEFDDRVQRKLRKYKRIGGEIVVERLSALTTTANDIQNIIDNYYRQYNLRFEILIIDFLGKMGSISRKNDDNERISDAYVDVANLVMKNGIEHCWTAQHVTRDAAKHRMKTRYEPTDTAKCIDINRHVHALYGLNRTEVEEEEGIIRMELIEQRDGLPHGRAVFNIDLTTQRLEEVSRAQRRAFDEEFFPQIFKDQDETTSVNKRPRTDDSKS